jgi:hypothetical protein
VGTWGRPTRSGAEVGEADGAGASACDLEGGRDRGMSAAGKKAAARAMPGARAVRQAGRPAGRTADGRLGGRGAYRRQACYGREGEVRVDGGGCWDGAGNIGGCR